MHYVLKNDNGIFGMSGMAEIGDRNGVQSVEVAGTILAAMADAGASLPLKDIASLTGLAPGKVHRYLVSLGRCELVRQELESGRYAIGPAAIAAGLSGLRSINVVRCASDKLSEIRDRTGETAVLAIWSRSGPVIVELEESSRQIYMNIRVGSILPLLRSAVGRVFAAYLPRPSVLDVLRRELADRRGGIPESVEEILKRTRRLGLGTAIGELVPGVTAFAAPVLDHRGQIAASVGVLGRSEDLDASPESEAASALTSLALSISRRMGYQPASDLER
jgi:DNA-binding IclR family transcriptional regulator